MGVPVYRTASTVPQYTDISVYRYTPKVEGAEDLVLSLFPSGLNLFSLSKFNCSSKKESEKYLETIVQNFYF